MFEFIEDMFYDWTSIGFAVWLIISGGIVYISWFVEIPSMMGDSAGFPFIVKLGLSILVPVLTYFLIANKEWTADTFGKMGNKR